MKSTLLHLRLPFSLLLLPVYLFAYSEVPNPNIYNAIVVFIVWHLFIYPASNAYNSYFDKDEGSIALIKEPPKVQKSLLVTAYVLEWTGLLMAFLVSFEFALAVAIYNSFSKAYSHPRIRIKKYPVLSFLVVFIFQGFFIYYSCYQAIGQYDLGLNADIIQAGLIASCLIGASYPLTQVYQHEEDNRRGDKTLSLLLGVKGSFLFSGFVFFLGFALMFDYWNRQNELHNFWVFALCCSPILGYFLWWFKQCLNRVEAASFKNAMGMTLISGLMMLLYFGWLWL